MHRPRILHPPLVDAPLNSNSTVPVSLTQSLQVRLHTTPKNEAPMLRRIRTQLTRHQIARVYAPRAQDLSQNAPIRPWCRNAHDSGRPRQGNGATFSGVGETKAAAGCGQPCLPRPSSKQQQRGRRRRTPGQRAGRGVIAEVAWREGHRGGGQRAGVEIIILEGES